MLLGRVCAETKGNAALEKKEKEKKSKPVSQNGHSETTSTSLPFSPQEH